MASTLTDDRTLRALLAESIESDLATAGRLTELLSRSVPWQFPGRLLEVLATSVSDAQLRNGILAVEYSVLHQYLHAVALADERLVEPASSSAYATDTVIAILDGDLLQARAFAYLDRAVEDAQPLVDAYRQFSIGSVSAYERTAMATCDTADCKSLKNLDTPGCRDSSHRYSRQCESSSDDRPEPQSASTDWTHREPELAPIAGVAGGLAGYMQSLPDARIRSLERAAAELGRAVPIHTPTGWQPPVVTRVDSALETLATVVDASTAADITALVDAERNRWDRTHAQR